MMPKNRLARVMLKNLKVVPGTEHEYEGHKPSPLPIKLPPKA